MQESPRWVWNKCVGSLKRQAAKGQKQSPSKEIALSLGEDNSEGRRLLSELKFHVQLQKPFLYQESLGYVWHKSWIIPKMTFVFGEQAWQALKQQTACEILQGELLSVVQKEQKNYTVEEVPLSRSTLKDLQGPSFSFSNFKFTKTSFQYHRQSFRFLLILKGKNSKRQTKGKSPVCISLLSSPFYVDSRKEARPNKTPETELPNQKRAKVEMDQFFETIRMSNGKKHTKVENSLEGFLNYFTAQNIRNKIKDPFYIAYHFSCGFKCFINLNKVGNLFEAMKVLQANSTETVIVVLVPVEGSLAQVRKVKQLFDKSLRMDNVALELSESNLDSRAWASFSRRQIAEAYREYFDDEQEFEYDSQSLKRQNYVTFQHTTQILLQSGGSKEVNMLQPLLTIENKQASLTTKPIRVECRTLLS